MAEVELIVELERARAVAGEWDALAVGCGMPMSSPGWMLSWFRHLAPAAAELRIVVVRDRGRVIGVVPLFVEGGRVAGGRSYRLLADDLGTVVGPVALPDREWEVAEAAARLLSTPELRPDSLELGPVPASSPWPMAFRERWPGWMRPLAYRRWKSAHFVSLQGGSFEVWFAERSGHFRSQSRRRLKRFEEAGGTFRLADARSVGADLGTFAKLHAGRWEGRGRSRLVVRGEGVIDALTEAADTLLADGRFRLLMLELDGRPICAQINLAAGGEVVGFSFGWDEHYRRLSPPLLGLLHVIEDSCARGERRIDLGWGGNPYKDRFATGTNAVICETLLPPGTQLARALPRALPAIVNDRARETTKRVLPDNQVARLRGLRARAARWRTRQRLSTLAERDRRAATDRTIPSDPAAPSPATRAADKVYQHG